VSKRRRRRKIINRYIGVGKLLDWEEEDADYTRGGRILSPRGRSFYETLRLEPTSNKEFSIN
jgi:hypothetical protein